jgi:hypothetical protein
MTVNSAKQQALAALAAEQLEEVRAAAVTCGWPCVDATDQFRVTAEGGAPPQLDALRAPMKALFAAADAAPTTIYFVGWAPWTAIMFAPA